MKTWWLQLNSREQRMVVIMAVAVGCWLLVELIWQPLNESLAKAEKKLVQQQELLSYVQQSAAKYQSLKASGSKPVSGSLSSIVNRVASQHQISIARVQPQGDDLQVSIDEIAFSQLLNWLNDLSTNSGLQVKAIDISKADSSGMVDIRRLQLGRG